MVGKNEIKIYVFNRKLTQQAEENKTCLYISTISQMIMSGGEEQHSKKSRSISIKILINYMQIITIISSFELNWPSYTIDYLSAQGNVSVLSSYIFSLECFERGNFIK